MNGKICPFQKVEIAFLDRQMTRQRKYNLQFAIYNFFPIILVLVDWCFIVTQIFLCLTLSWRPSKGIITSFFKIEEFCEFNGVFCYEKLCQYLQALLLQGRGWIMCCVKPVVSLVNSALCWIKVSIFNQRNWINVRIEQWSVNMSKVEVKDKWDGSFYFLFHLRLVLCD